MSVSLSLLRFLWLTDLKWQIRLVVSLCDVTPSLADRQPAVTCWETLCCCQKLCAPLQWLIAPSPPRVMRGGHTAGRATGGMVTCKAVCVCVRTCIQYAHNQCVVQVLYIVCEFAYKFSAQVKA